MTQKYKKVQKAFSVNCLELQKRPKYKKQIKKRKKYSTKPDRVLQRSQKR